MKTWVIRTTGKAIETYYVEADSEDEARALYERGKVDEPMIEIEDVEIVSIWEEERTCSSGS